MLSTHRCQTSSNFLNFSPRASRALLQCTSLSTTNRCQLQEVGHLQRNLVRNYENAALSLPSVRGVAVAAAQLERYVFVCLSRLLDTASWGFVKGELRVVIEVDEDPQTDRSDFDNSECGLG